MLDQPLTSESRISMYLSQQPPKTLSSKSATPVTLTQSIESKKSPAKPTPVSLARPHALSKVLQITSEKAGHKTRRGEEISESSSRSSSDDEDDECNQEETAMVVGQGDEPEQFDDSNVFDLPPPTKPARQSRLQFLSSQEVKQTVQSSSDTSPPAKPGTKRRKIPKNAKALAVAAAKEAKKKKRVVEAKLEEVPLHGLMGSIKTHMYSAKGQGPSMVKIDVRTIVPPDPSYKCRDLYPETHSEVNIYFLIFIL